MHIHVFTIDILPFDNCVCSGGGLRSWQIINGLRRCGAEVTYSMPAGAPLIKQQWDRLTAEQRENCFSHDKGERLLDLINKFKPDVTVILWPMGFWTSGHLREGMVTVFDINGFQNFESVGFQGSARNFDDETRRYLQKISCADVLITGSPEQRAYWGGLLGYHRNSMATTEMIDVPFCIEETTIDAAAGKRYDAGAPLFFCTGTFLPWNSPQGHLIRLARMIETAGRGELLVVGQPILREPYSGEVLKELEEVARFPFATLEHGIPFPAMVERIARRGVALDLHLPTFEREFALPVRTMTSLGIGMPVIFNNYSTLAAQVAHYGAGFCINPASEEEFENIVGKILSDPDNAALSTMSDAAIRLVRENYARESNMRRLFERIEEKLSVVKAPRRPRRASEAAGKANGHTPPRSLSTPFIRRVQLPRVLVISDDHENLLELRVHLPFRTMREQQLIDDYVLMARGNLVKRGDPGDHLRDIDVVWVQRRPTINSLLPINMFNGRFILDIDDNLLISPAYRPAFSESYTTGMRLLLRSAGTITATGSRLVDAIQRHAHITIEHKVVTAPNMTAGVHKKHLPVPKALLLACSDTLPLTASRDAFVRAIKRFTDLRQLPLLYVGPPLEGVPPLADDIQHVRTLTYRRYLALLRREPVMAVVPLEGNGDPLTDDFICSKSDVKMVEYGAASIPGVYARVAPYSDSTLPVGGLVDFSDEGALIQGLDAVYRDADRQAGIAYDSVREQRLAELVVPQWYEAIERERLSHPVRLDKILELAASYGSYMEAAPTPAQFDEAGYASAYPDAVEWAESTGQSVYDHYLKYGLKEGRAWHVGDPGVDIAHTAVRAKEFILHIDKDLQYLTQRVDGALGD
jgi:hypothetical protein